MPTTASSDADPGSGLAARLNKLFDTMRKASEAPMSNAAAAAAIQERTGISISPAYIWQLRSGAKTNPTIQHLRAIAEFFGVPASYLIDAQNDPNIDSQLELLQAMRDAGVRGLALRASGLTPQAITRLAAMIDHVRELENLPPLDPPPS